MRHQQCRQALAQLGRLLSQQHPSSRWLPGPWGGHDTLARLPQHVAAYSHTARSLCSRATGSSSGCSGLQGLGSAAHSSLRAHPVSRVPQHWTPLQSGQLFSIRYATTQAAAPKRKASVAELGMYGAAAAIGMIGFSYAAVPLYKVFCAATGYGGTVAGATTVEEKLKRRQQNPDAKVEQAAAQREITVWFNADVADDMPWGFKPTQECVRVRPGQSTLAFFTAHNKSDKAITGYSVYNVTPDKAAQYFNKIQCFCFEEQRLRAGEMVDMPVFFYLDPEMAADWNCRNIHNITLSYVFHKVDDEDLEPYDDDDDGPSQVKLHGPGLAPLPAGTGAMLIAQQNQQQQQQAHQ